MGEHIKAEVVLREFLSWFNVPRSYALIGILTIVNHIGMEGVIKEPRIIPTQNAFPGAVVEVAIRFNLQARRTGQLIQGFV